MVRDRKFDGANGFPGRSCDQVGQFPGEPEAFARAHDPNQHAPRQIFHLAELPQ